MYDPAPPIQAEPAWPQQTSNKAIISLILGLVSFMCSCITGIPAIILGIMAISDINRSRGMITGSGMAWAGMILGGITSLLMPIAMAIVFPAFSTVIDTVRAQQSMEQMANIGGAIKTFEATNGAYPADSYDAAGNPLLSWRVHILPLIDEQQLYSQFHLNEPWDSPHNRTLIAKMPRIYLVPDSDLQKVSSETTGYLAVIQNGAPFDGTPGSERGIRSGPKQEIDNASKTIMIVEVDADHEVAWTKPADLAGDKQAREAAVGERRAGGVYLALYADGHVDRVAGLNGERKARDWLDD